MDSIQIVENENSRLKVTKKELTGFIKDLTPEIKILSSELEKLEAQASKKNNEYDLQRESCKDLDMVAKRHTQLSEKLESVGNAHNELELTCDELQKRLMRKTEEVKNVMQSINELIKKIKLCSSLELSELPEFSIIDFHHENNMIKKYKVYNDRHV
jgi:chromosome segregation ATPase